MNILNSVYGDSTGGRWGATLKTAELLAARGHHVTLLVSPADAGRVPHDVRAIVDLLALRNSGHYDLLASWRAGRLIRARKFDAIIAHSGRAIHMLKRAAPRAVPVIAFNHSHNIGRTLKADAFFCITPYMKQIVDAATGGRKPAFVISNAVQLPPRSMLADRSGEEVFSVGAMGRMVPNKGFQHLVAALGLLAQEGINFRATIAGEGELMTVLKEQADALGIRDRIVFPGWIGPEQKASFFNNLDVMCFTSEWDVQGITILESFAWRTALIGTDVDGPSSCYQDGETALVVPPMDPVALAQALRRLHDDPGLRHKLATNGRAQAEHCYSDEVIAELLDRHVSEVVAQACTGTGRIRT